MWSPSAGPNGRFWPSPPQSRTGPVIRSRAPSSNGPRPMPFRCGRLTARAIPGHAVKATVTGKQIMVGSPRFSAEQGPLPADIDLRVHALEADGKTVVLILSDGQLPGLLALRDEPREDAATGLARLRGL